MLNKTIRYILIVIGVCLVSLFLLKTFNIFDFSILEEDIPTDIPTDVPTDIPSGDDSVIEINLDYENIIL